MGRRERVHYNLDLVGAESALRPLNSGPCYLAADRLLDAHFKDFRWALAPENVAEGVVLLDSLWGTRLYAQKGVAEQIALTLAANSARAVHLLASLGPADLQERPERVYVVAEEILPFILKPGGGSGREVSQNHSFASKFLHWCTRCHFPIVDRNARKTINAWQRELGVEDRVLSDNAAVKGRYIWEYERWIRFYSDLITSLGPAERERLKRADRESQSPDHRVENSLLRILDKVFYYQGGGRGMGRASD